MLSIYKGAFQKKLLKAYNYCSDTEATPGQLCFSCQRENSLTWFPPRRNCPGWFYCSGCRVSGDLVDFIAKIHGLHVSWQNKVLREFFPDLKCRNDARIAAFQAFQDPHASRDGIPAVARYWVLRFFREEADLFFTTNAAKLRESQFKQMRTVFPFTSDVSLDEWQAIFGTDFQPHARTRGQRFKTRMIHSRRVNDVTARFDTLARSLSDAFLMRLVGRPGETTGCLFVQYQDERITTNVLWSSHAVQRGLGFGANTCHPINVRQQQSGDPVLIVSDLMLALEMQVLFARMRELPPLMVYIPAKHFRIDTRNKIETVRYPFFTKQLAVQGDDGSFVSRAANTFQATPVHVSREELLPHMPLFEQFPQIMWFTLTTQSPLEGLAPSHP